MSNPTLNPHTYECVIVATDGGGAISITRRTGGILGVAFATDGSDGFVNVTIVEQGDLSFGMLGNIDGGAVGATLRGAALGGNLAQFQARDPANAGAVIDLSGIATRMTCFIIPTGAMPGGS